MESRGVYAKTSLSAAELHQLAELVEEYPYTCGSPICPPEHDLRSRLLVRIGMKCSDHVELSYYSSDIAASVCCYCASPEAGRPQVYVEQFFIVLPICDVCKVR